MLLLCGFHPQFAWFIYKKKDKGFNIVGLVCVSYKMSQLLSYFEQCQLFVQNFGAPTREPQPCSAVTLWCRFCLVTPLEVVCEAVQLTHSSLPLLNPVVTFLPAAAAAAPRVTGRALTGSILFPQQGELLLCHVRPGAPVSDTELHLCRGTSAGRRWRVSLPCCTNLWAADPVWTRRFYIF